MLRAYALQRRRPLTLHATIELPTLEEDPTESVAITGFIHLVRLYRPFDDDFVGLWNKTRAGCSTAWLALLQKQLVDALPAYLKSTESQAADLQTSQQWLRTMVWQLSIANGNLSSTSPDLSMTFQYPIEISRDLLAATGSLSQRSMEVHGVGLVSLGSHIDLGRRLLNGVRRLKSSSMWLAHSQTSCHASPSNQPRSGWALGIT